MFNAERKLHMKRNSLVLFMISLVFCGCSPKPEEITFPIEVGLSCFEANELLSLDGLYRSKRSSCGNYYCWYFFRFYEDCTYESAGSFYDTPRFNFMDTEKDTILGEYSTQGTTLIIQWEHGRYYGEINGDTLNLRLYMPTSEKVISRPYTLIEYEEDN